jgi:Protein of unknown function (DUF3891)
VIITQKDSVTSLYFHQGHASVATQIAARWKTKDEFPRFGEILVALCSHDDLEEEWRDSEVNSSDNSAHDFTDSDTLLHGERALQASKEQQLLKAKAHIEKARYKGRFVQALIALHQVRIVEPQRSEAIVADFIDEETSRVHTLEKELKLSHREVLDHYDLLYFHDSLSLILSNVDPKSGIAIPFSYAVKGVEYTIRRNSFGQITVGPWPYSISPLCTYIDEIEVPKSHFRDKRDLITALLHSPYQQRSKVIVPT